MRGVFWAAGAVLVVVVPVACGGSTVASAADDGSSGGSSSTSGGQGGDSHTQNIFVDTLMATTVGCLPRILTTDPQTGKIPCNIVEAQSQAGAVCDASRGRTVADSALSTQVLARLQEQGYCDGGGSLLPCSGFTLCLLSEAGPECHQAGVPQPNAGWCYIDPAHNPTDDPSLVASCPANQQRSLRFVDPMDATPARGAAVLIACFGAKVGTGGAGGATAQ